MTTDDFTTAACESAASKYRGDWDAFQREPVDDWGYSEAERRAHIAGWKAARDHLAAQEPTEEEVEAAAREMAGAAALIVAAGPKPWEWWTDRNRARFRKAARAALTAAKEARHATDE